MGRREGNDAKEATAPGECGQWRGTSEFRVGVRGLPAALAAYLNQKTKSDPAIRSVTGPAAPAHPRARLERPAAASSDRPTNRNIAAPPTIAAYIQSRWRPTCS